jgi:hypothetical protein
VVIPPISGNVRFLLGAIASIAGIIVAITGNELSKSITLFLTGKRPGRKPTRRDFRLWFAFLFSATIAVVFGSLAAFAPAHPNANGDILTPIISPMLPTATMLPTPTITPTLTPKPELFRMPTIVQVINGFDMAGYGKQSSLVRDSQGQLTLFVRDFDGNLSFLHSSDAARTWSAPSDFYQFPPPGGPAVAAAIDSADQIHVVWGKGPEASDVHYGMLVDQEWKVFDQIIGTGSFARDIAADSANHPHIAWSGIGIFHTTYDGTKWIQPPESVLPVGWHPDIQINATDKVFLFLNDSQFYATPGVSVYEEDNTEGHWGKPVKLSTSPFWSGAAAGAFDSQGNIYVAWMGATTESGGQDQVFFSRYIGGEWQAPFPIGEVNTSAGSTGQESPTVAFDSNDVFYVFWRGLNSDNHPVIFARALATENSKVNNVTQGWSPQIELIAPGASDAGWPSVADVWRDYRSLGVDIIWRATVGRDQVIAYSHVVYP